MPYVRTTDRSSIKCWGIGTLPQFFTLGFWPDDRVKAVACFHWNHLGTWDPYLETKLLPFFSVVAATASALSICANSQARNWCFVLCTQNQIGHLHSSIQASNKHLPPLLQMSNAIPSLSFGNVAAALDSRMDESDQTGNSGVSGSLPDPSRQNMHSNHLVQCSGLRELQIKWALRGYALWWSVSVRTVWKFGNSLTLACSRRLDLIFTGWHLKNLNNCWLRTRNPSIRHGVFGASYLSVQASSDIALPLLDRMYMAHRDPLGRQLCWLQRLGLGSSIMVGHCRLQHQSFPCVASANRSWFSAD